MTKVHERAVSCKEDKERTLRQDKGASDSGVLQRGQRTLRHDKGASDNGVLQRGHALETDVSRIILIAVEKSDMQQGRRRAGIYYYYYY